MCQFLQFYHHQTALSHTKSSECMLSSSDHSHTPDLVNGFVTYYTATSESLWTAFLQFYRIVRPLSHTRSSKLLCNLLHCTLRIALDCIFALLSLSRPLSHTRSSKLLCNLLHLQAQNRSGLHFCTFYHLQTTLTHQI